MESEYYDVTKLLSLNGIDGNRLDIYFCSSNRSADITALFNRIMKRYVDTTG